MAFKFGDVPYMSSGLHHPRYIEQHVLVNIYLHHQNDIVKKVFEYMKMYEKIK